MTSVRPSRHFRPLLPQEVKKLTPVLLRGRLAHGTTAFKPLYAASISAYV